MIFLGIGLLFAIFFGLRNGRNGVSYTSFECTQSLKGIFVLIVFFSHFRTYPPVVPDCDQPIVWLCNLLGQKMVAIFLFLSGYGVYESIKKKGLAYIDRFPRKRILKVLAQFDLAVLFFLLLGLSLGETFSLKKIFLSLVAWDNLGNSNWFIFAVLCAYLFVFVSFRIFSKSNMKALVAVVLLSMAYVYLVSRCKDVYWWDTMLCFSAGMLFSCLKDKFEKILERRFLLALIVLGTIALLINLFCIGENFVFRLMDPIFFCVFLMVLLFKMPLNSRVLGTLGKLVFPIYILQRIPMILLKHLGLGSCYILYLGLCFALTMFLALFFDRIARKIFK